MVILPTTKTPMETPNPGILAIYSLPKSGKTTALAALPANLILDTESGTKSLEALKVKIIGIFGPPESAEAKEARHKAQNYYLVEVIAELKKNNPYKFITLDTVTSYEDMCHYAATVAYMKSPVGINFNRYNEEDVRLSGGKLVKGVVKPKPEWRMITTALDKGGGYVWLRESYEKYIRELQSLGSYLILVAHVKTASLTKAGIEVETKDLNLTGRIKDMTSALLADSIGYLYREGKKAFISFIPSDEVRGGSRSKHLSGQTILISEELSDGTIKTYWEKIYI